ncbi:4'-phosphopantetheinyl transferase superfamily [Crepidotus variabilis]|uniref:holo-[acyl-carrier-protein] synthase n=1 Tax=Crepidotus variabilis TaxID=179855 RepID=A0A9P6JUK7_9AGAR|nr:4'-phosphopantetheinyl transferase superfamily [Crepidotus variabilis]
MENIQVWAVILDESALQDELYQRALTFVDAESQAKIKKFYHRVDSYRTLIGRLLVRRMLVKKGISLSQMTFATTQSGKSYLTAQNSNPPIAYNVTHDNNVIAMVVGPGRTNPPAFGLGIDVMKTRVPGKSSINEFIEVVGDQLSQQEHTILQAASTDDEKTRQFFWMWTLKEAYTKAIGMGLGFDFKRVEFHPQERLVKVDGQIPVGWKFRMFVLKDGEDQYQGVCADFMGNSEQAEVLPENIEGNSSWLSVEEGVPFLNTAMSVLHT